MVAQQGPRSSRKNTHIATRVKFSKRKKTHIHTIQITTKSNILNEWRSGCEKQDFLLCKMLLLIIMHYYYCGAHI